LRADEYFIQVDFAIEELISLLYPLDRTGVAEGPKAWHGFAFCCIENRLAVENLSNDVPRLNYVYHIVAHSIKVKCGYT
jgi:hypothetical protein